MQNVFSNFLFLIETINGKYFLDSNELKIIKCDNQLDTKNAILLKTKSQNTFKSTYTFNFEK